MGSDFAPSNWMGNKLGGQERGSRRDGPGSKQERGLILGRWGGDGVAVW